MGMERREEKRENGVREGTSRSRKQHFCCKISFSEISLKLRRRGRDSEESVCACAVQCVCVASSSSLGIRWWKSGGDRVKSPFSCDVDHNLYGHFMARRRRKKEGDPDPMQSATVDGFTFRSNRRETAKASRLNHFS